MHHLERLRRRHREGAQALVAVLPYCGVAARDVLIAVIPPFAREYAQIRVILLLHCSERPDALSQDTLLLPQLKDPPLASRARLLRRVVHGVLNENFFELSRQGKQSRTCATGAGGTSVSCQ